MSYRSTPIHPGQPANWKSRMSYAYMMIFCRGTWRTVRDSPAPSRTLEVPTSGLAGLTEAISNSSALVADWANACGATQRAPIWKITTADPDVMSIGRRDRFAVSSSRRLQGKILPIGRIPKLTLFAKLARALLSAKRWCPEAGPRGLRLRGALRP
jgi:hypothetical protein